MTSAGGTAVASFARCAALRKFSGGASGAAAGRDFFSYPQAAVVQSLGDIPAGLCDPISANGCGGGAPSGRVIPRACREWASRSAASGRARFMVNDSGTFGPWNFGGSQYSNGEYQTRILPQAAFHVREQPRGQAAATVTTRARWRRRDRRAWASRGPGGGGGSAVGTRMDLLSPGPEGTYAARAVPFGCRISYHRVPAPTYRCGSTPPWSRARTGAHHCRWRTSRPARRQPHERDGRRVGDVHLAERRGVG